MVSKGMLRRYSHAALAFLTFLSDMGFVLGKLSQFDNFACQWVEFLYADGERKGLASDGLAGLQHFMPECQGRLKQAWKLVKVWQRVEPPNRVLPLSLLVLLGMAGMAVGFELLQQGCLFASMGCCGAESSTN